jgi:hypothetical protein
MLKKIFLMLMIWVSSSCISFADIYQQTDVDGNVTYSDVNTGQNADISSTIKNTNTVSSPKPSTPQPATTSATAEAVAVPPVDKPHTIFEIESPKNEETLYNQPTISVEIKIEPTLQEGETIQLLLDGKPMGPAQPTTHFALTYVDRGTHQLSAQLFKKNQMIKQTGTITIYVHKTNINNINNSPAGK